MKNVEKAQFQKRKYARISFKVTFIRFKLRSKIPIACPVSFGIVIYFAPVLFIWLGEAPASGQRFVVFDSQRAWNVLRFCRDFTSLLQIVCSSDRSLSKHRFLVGSFIKSVRKLFFLFRESEGSEEHHHAGKDRSELKAH